MGKMLIIGDDDERINHLKKSVGGMDHSVISAGFDDAVDLLYTKDPDIAIVDLTTQKRIVEMWGELRSDIDASRTSAIVIIPQERVRDIELLAGIRDFILYPFDIRELEIRVKLILTRLKKASAGEVIKIGNLVIDPVKYEVTVDGWSVVLTLKEFELLKYLATHRGRVLTREVLLDQIWGYDYYGGTRTVDVHIGRLRTKIETSDYSFIKTVRGVGYIFTDEYSEE